VDWTGAQTRPGSYGLLFRPRHRGPRSSRDASASRCGRSAAPASGSSSQGTSVRLRSQSLWSRDVRSACPISSPMRPAEDGQRGRQLIGIAAGRLGQNSTVSRPGIVGWTAVLPLAITTARRAMSCSPLTSTVRSPSVSLHRDELGPSRLHRGGRPAVVEVACHPQHAFGTLESQRSIPRVRRRGGERNRPRSRFPPERSRVLRGTQPQYGHSPPTSSRSTTASVSPCREGRPRSLLQRRHHETHDVNSCGNFPTSVSHHRRRAATKKAKDG